METSRYGGLIKGLKQDRIAWRRVIKTVETMLACKKESLNENDDVNDDWQKLVSNTVR